MPDFPGKYPFNISPNVLEFRIEDWYFDPVTGIGADYYIVYTEFNSFIDLKSYSKIAATTAG
jgi:hypothetical protein